MNDEGLVIHGWEVHAHPLFLDQLDALISAVEADRTKDAEGYGTKRAAKLLAAVLKVAFEVIPGDPTRSDFRQGDTLGDEHRHWFRVKFLQQFRLFFRYRTAGRRKVIVLAWVNDESTKRAYGAKSDAYAVFRTMLDRGDPPDDWDALLRAASRPATRARLLRTRAGRPATS